MKLDWVTRGRASIAVLGSFTCSVFPDYMQTYWRGRVIGPHDPYATFESERAISVDVAQAACESWLEQHDRPEWHDCGENSWLSWAEWRGFRLIARPALDGREQYVIQASHKDGKRHIPCSSYERIEAAKDAAEKWVREQGA